MLVAQLFHCGVHRGSARTVHSISGSEIILTPTVTRVFHPGLRGRPRKLPCYRIQFDVGIGRRSPAERGGFNIGRHKARDDIADQPLAWLRLLGLKLRNFWSAFAATPPPASLPTQMREQGVTFPGIHFGLLAALALPAMILTWNTARLGRWITGGIFSSDAGPIASVHDGSYRLPIVPGLAVSLPIFGLVTLFSKTSRPGNVRPVLFSV